MFILFLMLLCFPCLFTVCVCVRVGVRADDRLIDWLIDDDVKRYQHKIGAKRTIEMWIPVLVLVPYKKYRTIQIIIVWERRDVRLRIIIITSRLLWYSYVNTSCTYEYNNYFFSFCVYVRYISSLKFRAKTKLGTKFVKPIIVWYDRNSSIFIEKCVDIIYICARIAPFEDSMFPTARIYNLLKHE